jgi:drug/metabolite transporter (DMT)-like permease
VASVLPLSSSLADQALAQRMEGHPGRTYALLPDMSQVSHLAVRISLLFRTLSVYLALGMATTFWGANFVAAKFIVPYVPAFTIAAVRFTFASLCFLLLLRLSNQRGQTILSKDIPLFLLLGASGYALNTQLFYWGMRTATASEGGVIAGTIPAITAVLAALIVKERLSRLKLLGLLLAFSGAGLVIVGGRGLELHSDHALADLAIFCSATCFAFYSVLSKFSLRRYSPLVATTYATMAGALFVSPASILEHGWDALRVAPVEAWLAIAFTTLFASFVSYGAWSWGLQRIGATRASVFNNVQPVVAMFLGILILGDSLALVSVAGVAFVIAGIMVVNHTRGSF